MPVMARQQNVLNGETRHRFPKLSNVGHHVSDIGFFAISFRNKPRNWLSKPGYYDRLALLDLIKKAGKMRFGVRGLNFPHSLAPNGRRT